MTAAIFVFGTRSDGLRGVFVAPPGKDADSSPVTDMLLYYGAYSTQIMAKGLLTTTPATVPLGFSSYIPSLFIHRIQNVDYGGYALPGFCKPDAHFWSNVNITATATPSSFDVTAASGNLFYYAVSKAAP